MDELVIQLKRSEGKKVNIQNIIDFINANFIDTTKNEQLEQDEFLSIEYGKVEIIKFISSNINNLFEFDSNIYLREGIGNFYECILKCFYNEIRTKTIEYKDNFIKHLKKCFHCYDDDENITEKIIQTVSNYLHINILVISNDNIYYYDYAFIPYKKIMILIKNESKYDLLFTEKSKIFSMNDEVIKKIIKSEYVKQYNFKTKEFGVLCIDEDNLDNYLNVKGKKGNKKTDDNFFYDFTILSDDEKK